MLRITHLRGRRAPGVEHFDACYIRAGSAPGSELQFPAHDERAVAPQHAELREEGGILEVLDLGSPWGTWVNGVRIQRQRLVSGDRVALGGLDGPEFRVERMVLPVQRVPSRVVDGGVDLDTAQRMVTDAVLKATGGDDKTRAIVATKVAQAQRRWVRSNIALAVGILVVLAAMVVSAASLWQSQRVVSALGTDIGLDRGAAKPHRGAVPTRVLTGREIYDANKTALYLLGWLAGNKVGGVCTAFALQPSLLATNAHCVGAFQVKGGTPVVTQNDSAGRVRYRILAAEMHPRYKVNSTSADSPDVGLLRIDGKVQKTVTLANDAELSAIGTGDDLFVLGFPGRVMDPLNPSATFLQGHVGRLLGLGEQAPQHHDDAVLIQHDAGTRGGNSGSPIFNQYGHVIGIHAAHLDEENEVRVDGKVTIVVESSPFRIGMRIDLLNGVRAP